MKNPTSFLKALCFLASALLVLIGLFHASGINYLGEEIQSSDLPDFIKQIFPVLFLIPTIQLMGFAVLGSMAPYLKKQAKKILLPLALLVMIDACLAFYLNAFIPAVVLLLPSGLFMIAAFRKFPEENTKEYGKKISLY